MTTFGGPYEGQSMTYGQWCPTGGKGSTPNVDCPSCPAPFVEVDGACVPPPKPPRAPNKAAGQPGCSDKAGNPINIGNGNKYLEETDYSDGFTNTLSFRRSYNSGYVGGDSIVGASWQHGFSLRVVEQSSLAVALVRADGKTHSFSNTRGSWEAEADTPGFLVELKDADKQRSGWHYVAAGIQETYDSRGRLIAATDRASRTRTLAYDAAVGDGGDGDPDTLDFVADDLGRRLVFIHDAQKRIATVIDPWGSEWTCGYDSAGNLVSVVYPDGRSRTYHYNEADHTGGANLPHALTGITDENGDRYATYRYGEDGKAVATSHAHDANAYELTYHSDGSTTVIDPLGASRTYTFADVHGVPKSTGQSQPGGSGCGPASTAITYDDNGNVASRSDFNGNTTCYEYDSRRNLEIARLEGMAAGTACPANLLGHTPAPNSAERIVRTEWGTGYLVSRPTRITEPGRETTFSYDSYGNLTKRSVKDIVRGTTRTWATTYTYHATVPGIVVRKVENGPRTDVSDLTTTDYYAPDESCAGGHYGCRGQVKQVTNALGHVTRYDEYDAHGRATRIIDPNGLVTTFTYTPRGWLETRTVGGEVTRVTRPDGSHVGYEYDAAHRLVAVVAQDGSRLTYTLDNAGNRTREEITGPDGSYVYYTRSRTFDALGRLWQDIGAYNQTVTYEYDAQGNLKQVDGARTDVADVTQHSYDALDRLTQTLNADGGVVQIQPNALDQIVRVVDPASQATTHTVNALGDVLQIVSADTGTTVRTYDTGGNLKTEKDARGITVTYTYDALNRLTKKQSNQSGSPIYQYTYDTCANGIGRLCGSLRNSVANVSFSYDALGRLASRTDADGVNATTAYTYRPGGQIETVTYHSGRTVTYSYDEQGRISQVSTRHPSGSPVTVLAINFVHSYPFAGPQSFSYGNGKGFYLSRDQDYRPWYHFDGMRYKLYNHDPAGNVASLTDISGTVLTYSYDAAGRLTGALDTAAGSFGTLGYSYDANGNRLVETRNASHLPYVYDPPGSNWLHQKGSELRYKTASGNTASISGLATFTYDGFNRLATAQTAAETTTYAYNALGQRMRKSNQHGLSTVFHYGPNGELLWEKDANGNTKAYVWHYGRPLARIDNDTEIYYYHVDHLGTPQAMSDSTGSLVWKANYEPFGKATVSAASTVENNLRFPGQYFDRETGLHYNYYRSAYNPGTGRYEEVDPIGIAGGLNLYAYAMNDPIRQMDQFGLFPESYDHLIYGPEAKEALNKSPAF